MIKHKVIKPRFHAERCISESGKILWTVYDRIHWSTAFIKIGLFHSKKSAQKFAHTLGCECRIKS